VLLPKFQTDVLEAGVDEAGRGCLAGPVVAAAVILPDDFYHPLLNDSKKMTEKNRELLQDVIKNEALAYCIAEASAEEIDQINILQATFLAMHRAIEGLKLKPGFLLIDGNRFKVYKEVPHQTIVEGDGKYLHIAAASVLAKTYRDDLMKKLHAEFDHYGWDKNKGYGTEIHRKAIETIGITCYHRKTFTLKNKQLQLF
jgi:ribonuclease HII